MTTPSTFRRRRLPGALRSVCVRVHGDLNKACIIMRRRRTGSSATGTRPLYTIFTCGRHSYTPAPGARRFCFLSARASPKGCIIIIYVGTGNTHRRIIICGRGRTTCAHHNRLEVCRPSRSIRVPPLVVIIHTGATTGWSFS